MCCGGPAWKREVVPDHKFDFIDTRDFHSTGFFIRLQYIWVYILVIKSFLVYISDIYTATTMLTSNDWSNKIFNSCKDPKGCVAIPFGVAKWLFVGCIIFSFLLLGYEARKAKKIIASRDISFAYTNIMAQNYYSLRSYDHFCFFCHINDSTKKKDDFAFFIFFTFKEWKRLLLADAPRQTINALTLYSFYLAKRSQPGKWYDAEKYFDPKDMVTNLLLVTIVFTVLIFIGSLLLLIAAAILYVPLLCYIRGNLKEYCCHKVDKRISELVKRKQKQRLAKQAQLAKKEAAGDIVGALPQPTLPNISLDDEEDLKTVSGKTGYAASVRTAADSYWSNDYKSAAYTPDYPPMPAYDPRAYPPQPGYTNDPNLYGHDDSTLYDHDEYGSKYSSKISKTSRSSGGQELNYNGQYHADPYGRNGSFASGGYDQNAYYGGYDNNNNNGGAYGGTYDAGYPQQQQQYQQQHQPPPRGASRNGQRWGSG